VWTIRQIEDECGSRGRILASRTDAHLAVILRRQFQICAKVFDILITEGSMNVPCEASRIRDIPSPTKRQERTQRGLAQITFRVER